jgi:four helix bundle protein
LPAEITTKKKMEKIERFEDLRCWRASRELVRMVYLACREGELRRDLDTRSQIRRSALSSMSNIAEGFARHSDAEFSRFLDFSQGSATEVKSITYVLEDLTYLSLDAIISMRLKAEETRALTLGLMKYVRDRQRPART